MAPGYDRRKWLRGSDRAGREHGGGSSAARSSRVLACGAGREDVRAPRVRRGVVAVCSHRFTPKEERAAKLAPLSVGTDAGRNANRCEDSAPSLRPGHRAARIPRRSRYAYGRLQARVRWDLLVARRRGAGFVTTQRPLRRERACPSGRAHTIACCPKRKSVAIPTRSLGLFAQRSGYGALTLSQGCTRSAVKPRRLRPRPRRAAAARARTPGGGRGGTGSPRPGRTCTRVAGGRTSSGAWPPV